MDGQLHIIQAFTNSLSANTSLEKVCSELVEKTIEFFGTVEVTVYLYTDKTKELVRTASSAENNNSLKVTHLPKTLLPGEGFAGMVFKKGKAELLNNKPLTKGTNGSFEMAVPIAYGGKVIGVIHVAGQQQNKMNQGGIMFLSVLSSIAATVIIKTIASTRLNLTETKLLQKRTNTARDKQRLDEIKGRMEEILYSLSHEFRGPVLTTMSLIERMANDPKRFDEYHPMLKTTVNRLDSILLNIYYYSNNLREPVYNNAVIPERVIQEMVVFLRREFKIKFDVRIRCDSEGYIITDENRFKVILRSLLINALQYGHLANQKPAIDIDLQFSSESCKIAIRDHGPGMPKTLRKKSNRVFNRGTAMSKGAGIGIFVCKELARKIGAKIEWICEEGKGTKVLMEMPNRDK